jgi:hypothetical protein
MRALLTLIVGVILLVSAAPGWAATDRRIALVIGNSAYRKFPQLPNPRNDAEDVTAALKRVGFTVLGGADLTREQMRDSLRQFARSAQDAEAALVFYAGHGLQYRGRNYLVPIDAKLEDEFDLEYETVRVDDVVEELNRADGPRILVLDACRNLPLSTRSRDPFSSTGLAKLSGRGLIVAYATQANQVAYDGTGRNSIFTGAFIKSVQEPGLDVAQVFQRVSINVDRATGGRQTPELSLSYPGQFYLNKGETEREAWPRARASNDPQQLRDFIAKYPSSFLVDDAKDLIQRLESRGVAQAERTAPAQPERGGAPQQAPTLQLARRPDDDAASRAREEAERLAWQRLQDEQKRRAEARQQAERERLQAEEQERQRVAQEEERRKAELRRAELEKQAEEARQKKVAEERAAAEARERQRLEREARLEEERRRLEARKAEETRLAEEARQKKLAEERAAAEARERQRLEREARLEEDRRQAEARKAEQDRLAEEARQRRLAEDRAAAEARERQRLEREARLEDERRQVEIRKAEQERVAEEARQRRVAEQQAAEEARQRRLAEERQAAEARERQRLAEESARREDEQRRVEVTRAEQERARLAAAEQAERNRLEWARLEDEQQRRRAAAQAEPDPTPAPAGGSVQTTIDALKSSRANSATAMLVPPAAPAESTPDKPMRIASNDATQQVPVAPTTPSAFPKEALSKDRLVRETKAELGRIGCYDDEPDSDWDKDARDALRRFSRQVKLSPVPSEPSQSLLDDLKGRPANVCPLECGAGERVQGDRCVAVARPDAKPVVRREPKPRPVVAQERRAPAPEPRVVRPRPAPAPAQAPVATASSAPKPAIRSPIGVGF